MYEKLNSRELSLRGLREAAGYTQEQLAKKLNLGNRIISDWENGHKIPKFDNAVLLASALEVSLKTLAIAFKMDVANIPND